MKKRNLLIIIGVLIIASLVITLVILNNKNKDKDKDKTPTDKNLISINAPEGINVETTFIEGNKYMVINLINNTKEIIKSSTLKVTFSTKEEIKELDLIPVGNKSIIKIFIPEELRKNILKEKIKINYEIKENTNEMKLLDVSKLSNPMPNAVVKDGEIFVNIEEENTIGSDITLLKGYVILYDNNKIVGTTDFEISDIKNNSKFNIDVKLPGTSSINDNEESLLEYDKIEIYYTFAY